MAQEDYYDVLGVSRDASDKEINSAYRKLAKKYHPDINHEPGAEEKYKKINEAYEVLHDQQKRAQYDQFGSAGVNGQGGFGGGAGQGYGDFSGFGDFSDIFGDIFGNGARQQHVDPTAPTRGEDLDYTLTIDFMDAITGKKTQVSYTRSETCSTCQGSGAEKGTHPTTCDKCQGTGYMTITQQSLVGVVRRQTTCDKCHGRGVIIEHPCQTCHGNGVVDGKNTIEVNIPAGIDNGQQLRYEGQGEAGKNGGPYGDLYISYRIKPSKEFERSGNTIYTTVPISFAQATLGDEINVKTVHGEKKLKIPAGTQPNKKFTLHGEGVPYLRGNGNGDQVTTVQVQIPKSINEKQREALVEFVKAGGGSITPQEKGFFERLKDKLQ
ncbi:MULTISPECIES: molecular chaperone DnaJ [Lactobacillus]|uniref:Chaperone protein DnaJ n=1 Tax=Lactobacillus apis TaxID=303541 RepID=A0A0F4LT79_9LACO|nr:MULTISPECIES: molecular chaperone DnaJ [Lactobacillus]AWM73793.1 molecular chaperone DnaJ [Lactobacillus apis]KJY61499.1 Chaperone protein DnaJ [Lactobacillus apis]MBC6361028.1 molecular chaperone DnaJ [Lactobacillus apis]MBH9985526.1 molecular chaperone DnaJ [Lactobacillus sp. M0390]MBI0092795.1 molecular chaperone DnaJ [Lactobacillus sp. M0403]